MKKKLLALMMVFMLVFSFAGCGASSDKGGETIFNVATTGGFDTMNFFTTESAMVYDWLNITYDSLIAYDENYEAIPRAAEKWENDGNTWTFHLRDDIYFNDGEQLTSADVKYTYEKAIDSYMYSLYTAGIDSIDCPDDFTVVFNCSNAKPDMLYQIVPILPEHVWSQADDVLTYESAEVVGSGPFIYSAERSGNGNTTFVKNENYWGSAPKIDVLVFSEYDNTDAMAQALKLGEVDACYTLEKTQLDAVQEDGKVEVGIFDSIGFEHIAYNLLDPLCSDKVIRHAIDYCVDKETVIEMSYSGQGTVAYGPVNNEGYIYEPDKDIKRDFDIEGAKQILDDAGYVDSDGDGIREKDGKKITLEVITASDRSSWQTATVNMLIENCAKAGIEITWNPMDKTAMWDTCYDGNPDWQINIDGWGGTTDPGAILCLFEDYEVSGYAGVSYQNPDFDKMYANVKTTVDVKERAGYIEECQKILYEDCPYTFLCFDKKLQAINSEKWKGYESTYNGFFGNELAYNYCNIELR